MGKIDLENDGSEKILANDERDLSRKRPLDGGHIITGEVNIVCDNFADAKRRNTIKRTAYLPRQRRSGRCPGNRQRETLSPCRIDDATSCPGINDRRDW